MGIGGGIVSHIEKYILMSKIHRREPLWGQVEHVRILRRVVALPPSKLRKPGSPCPIHTFS